MHLAHRIGEPHEVVLGQPTRAQALLVDATGRADQPPHRRLLCAHLHAEDRDRQLLIDSDVFADVQRERRCRPRVGPRRSPDRPAEDPT